MIIFLFLILLISEPVHAQESQENPEKAGFIDNMCKQILADEIELSPKVLLGAAVEKAKDIPEKLWAKTEVIGESAMERASDIPETLASGLESFKKSPEKKSPQSDDRVLGVSTDRNSLTASAYNAGIDLLSLLIREWQWTLGGLAVLGIAWSLRG